MRLRTSVMQSSLRGRVVNRLRLTEMRGSLGEIVVRVAVRIV
jgi:hypothetical protein